MNIASEHPLAALEPLDLPYLEPSPSSPPPSTVHRIFFGPFGLRAGWSLLIYFALAFLLVTGIRVVHDRVTHKHPATTAAAGAASTKAAAPKPDLSKPMAASPMIIQESIIFAALVLLSGLMAFIERRRLSAFGLGGTRSLGRFVIGAVWGIVAISTVVALLYFSHLLVFDARLLHGSEIFRWGAIQLFAFLLVGLLEEYLFRGYIQFTLTRGMVGLGNLISKTHSRSIAFWLAAVITSAIFLLAHTGNDGENWLGLLQVFLAGLVFVVALWRTGSLWWAIGFHMAWDWGQSFLYGVPDSGGLFQGRLFATHALGNPLFSGGTDGPEGSILCAPVLLLVILVLCYTHPSPQPGLEPIAKPADSAASGLAIA